MKTKTTHGTRDTIFIYEPCFGDHDSRAFYWIVESLNWECAAAFVRCSLTTPPPKSCTVHNKSGDEHDICISDDYGREDWISPSSHIYPNSRQSKKSENSASIMKYWGWSTYVVFGNTRFQHNKSSRSKTRNEIKNVVRQTKCPQCFRW